MFFVCYNDILRSLSIIFVREHSRLDKSEQLTNNFLPVIGHKMMPTMRMLSLFCKQNETILITGPTGSGKSKVARWCHQQSHRSTESWSSIDLNTIPESMQLAELFGWKKGAFTSAEQNKTGIVELAENGTLFIDEIDKLSIKSQSGLLDFLETKKYRPLGVSEAPRDANVRILVGTNVNLMEKVKLGEFREDLYYRINVLPIKLLPLNQRLDEMNEWAKYMVHKVHACSQAQVKLSFDQNFFDILHQYDWPGNLRQLDNVLKRAYALASGAASDEGFRMSAQCIRQSLEFESDFKPNTQNSQHNSRESIVSNLIELESSINLLDTEESFKSLLKRAAEAWLDQAEREGNLENDQHFNILNGFRGLVYERAFHRYGGVKNCFKALGKDKAIQSRNYHKEYKRELDRLEGLLRSAGESYHKDDIS